MNLPRRAYARESLAPLGSIWPFPTVNGIRTPESIALETTKQPPAPTQYELCQQTQPEEALL